RPLAAPHDRLSGSVLKDAVDVEVARADHEIDMDDAPVAAGLLKVFVAHLITAAERELVRGTQGDVTRRVLVEQRVVEEQSGLRNRGTVRHARDLAESSRARGGLDQLAQHRFTAFRLNADDAARREPHAEIL